MCWPTDHILQTQTHSTDSHNDQFFSILILYISPSRWQYQKVLKKAVMPVGDTGVFLSLKVLYATASEMKGFEVVLLFFCCFCTTFVACGGL